MSVVWHTTDALRMSIVIMEKGFLLVNVEKGTSMILKALPVKVSKCYNLIAVLTSLQQQ